MERDLTTLEYYVLGVISVEPQSGYSIINYFESELWGSPTSPGSIYPILKRLEKQDIISGELEIVQEARSRKMYTLTALGETILDDWLRSPVTKEEAAEQRPTMMMKFLFMEKRLSREAVLRWLDSYQEATDYYIKLLTLHRNPQLQEWSLHQSVLIEGNLMELQMQLDWVKLARERLRASA